MAAKRAVGDSGAYRVGIWLGCDTPGTKKAFTGDGPLPEVFLAVVGARLSLKIPIRRVFNGKKCEHQRNFCGVGLLKEMRIFCVNF